MEASINSLQSYAPGPPADADNATDPAEQQQRRVLRQIHQSDLCKVVLVYDQATEEYWAVKSYSETSVTPDAAAMFIENERAALEHLAHAPHRLLTHLSAAYELDGRVQLATPYIGLGTSLYDRMHGDNGRLALPGAGVPLEPEEVRRLPRCFFAIRMARAHLPFL